MNFKNATNVSAADSVARGASIYMRPRAKLGDRREREVEAGASVRLNSRWGEKKVPISSQSSSGCDSTCDDRIPHQSEILDGIAGSQISVGSWRELRESVAQKKRLYVRRRERAQRIL